MDMTAEKSKTGGTTEEAKQKILESLSKIKDDEKVNFLVNKLVQHEVEAQKAKAESQQLQAQTKRGALLEKKVSTLEGLLTKTEVAKAKLEELCRELSKRNKEISETNAQRLKLIEENHRSTVEHLKESLGDIQQTVNQRREQTQRVADVEQLSASLKDLSTEYEKRLADLKNLYEEREESLGTISKNKDEEITVLKTELKAMHDRVQTVFGENVTLKKQLIENDTKMKTALESEIEMRKLLNNYTEKYQNLLSSLARSNESFEKVKKEMARMNGNLIKVEGESRKWKQRVEESTAEVAKLTAFKVENEKAMALKERQLTQLQELCRRLKNDQSSKANDSTDPIKPQSSENQPE